MNGKGSSRRPMQIPPKEFDQRWAETFGVALHRYVMDQPEMIPRGGGGGDPEVIRLALAIVRDQLDRYMMKNGANKYGHFIHRDPDVPCR